MIWIPSNKYFQEEFNASGTWYKPKRFPAVQAYITVVNGGTGAGGGTTGLARGGGASGRFLIFMALLSDDSYSIVIGSGGAGSTGANGDPGGESSFGTLYPGATLTIRYIHNYSLSTFAWCTIKSGLTGGAAGNVGTAMDIWSPIFGRIQNDGGASGGTNGGGGGGASLWGVGGAGGTYPNGNGGNGTKGAGGGGGARTTSGNSTGGNGGDGHVLITYWLPNF